MQLTEFINKVFSANVLNDDLTQKLIPLNDFEKDDQVCNDDVQTFCTDDFWLLLENDVVSILANNLCLQIGIRVDDKILVNLTKKAEVMLRQYLGSYSQSRYNRAY